MSPTPPRHPLDSAVRDALESYFRDLGETPPNELFGLVMQTVERPLLETVMARTDGNQSMAAQWLGINRNTLRRKLTDHGLA